MNNWRTLLLAALAALSLQACEVQVNTGATKVHSPPASLPEETQLNAPATTAAVTLPPPEPAAAPVEAAAVEPPTATVLPEPTAAAPEVVAQAPAAPTAEAPAALPVLPDTSTLSAPAENPAATVPASAPTAAPTELALFIEANTPGAKTAADKKTDKRRKKS